MARKVIGPTGSLRRRWLFLCTSMAAIALAVIFIPSALAVHDLGFQLDGDPFASNVTNLGGNTQANDWDSFFAGSGGASNPIGSTPISGSLTNGFTAGAATQDFNVSGGKFATNDSSTFTIGSKDILDVNGWSCTPANNVTDKGDIMNTYAVAYTDPNIDPLTGKHDQILYFGQERSANTGDANVGFWFLQGGASCPAGGGSFVGNHADGDIFVVSAFTKGGAVSTITAYRWTIDAAHPSGYLNPTPVASGADCTNVAQPLGDSTCATANKAALTGWPWLTYNKTNALGNKVDTGEFFEGGLNLTKSNLGDHCFNTFLSNTRSSQSLTATLYDYAEGNLGECKSSVSTTAAGTASGSIGGGSVSSGTDTATVTVTGIPTWGGTVDFYLCGPIASGACSANGVKSNPAATPNGVPVSSSTTNQATSGTATLTSAGRYCWYGVFTPDANSLSAGVKSATDDGSGTTPNPECFNVSPVTPSLPTTAGASPINLGQTATDQATLSGAATEPGTNGGNSSYSSINATNGAFAGAITFKLLGPGDCSTVATGTGTNPSSPQSVTGNTTYNASFTPNHTGTFHWVATYNGPGANNTAVNNVLPQTYNGGCTDTAEDVVVRQLPTTTVTTPSDSSGVALVGPVALGTTLFDKAVVTGSTAGGTPTGTVTFWLCNPSQVTGSPGAEVCTGGTQVGNPVNTSGIANSNPPAASALSSPGQPANTAGTWCFRATFTPPAGGAYTGSSDATHGECIVVSPAPTGTVTSPSETTGKVNDSVTDHAVITGVTAGGTPTGSVQFYICDPLTVSGSSGSEFCDPSNPLALAVGSPVTVTAVVPSSPPKSEATSNAITADKVGVWCFAAVYTPDTVNYTGSGDQTHGECFTISDTSSGVSVQNWLPNDHFMLSTTGGTPLKGTVNITLRSGACSAGGTTVYTEPQFNSPAGGWASGTTFDTTNGTGTTFRVNAANQATPYFWKIVFTSSNSFVSSFSECERTDITVNDTAITP